MRLLSVYEFNISDAFKEKFKSLLSKQGKI